MRNSRGARTPIRTTQEQSQRTQAIDCAYSFLSGLSCRRLTDSSREFFLFGSDTERLGDLHSRSQLRETRFGDPGLCVCLRIVDGEIEFDGIAIGAAIALSRSHLIAVRLALRAEPRFFIEPDRFDDKRVAFPSADGVAIPSRIRVVRKFASIHPDFTEGVMAF